MRKKNGEAIWVMDVVRVIKNKNRSPVELAGFIVNITERKQAEKALRRAQKMEAVGQLTGGIAHDFNNILGIIQGNLDLLEHQTDKPDQTRKRVNSLKRVTERAIKLTQQLLGFSRTQADLTTVTDINKVIESMGELTQRSITPEISISYELESKLWPVRIDTSDFQDALLNLIINARDAITQNGTIVVSTQNVHIEQAYENRFGNIPAGDYVKLSVTDSGIGIQAASLEKIFEPFYTTKEYGKATFTLDGEMHTLTLYENVSKKGQVDFEPYLFLPFHDATNGEQTYGGGRYLDFPIPTNNTLVLDFNKCYNPYCAYSDKFNCPITPRINTLSIAIEVGMLYSDGH